MKSSFCIYISENEIEECQERSCITLDMSVQYIQMRCVFAFIILQCVRHNHHILASFTITLRKKRWHISLSLSLFNQQEIRAVSFSFSLFFLVCLHRYSEWWSTMTISILSDLCNNNRSSSHSRLLLLLLHHPSIIFSHLVWLFMIITIIYNWHKKNPFHHHE
jgi:hypothetical protein